MWGEAVASVDSDGVYSMDFIINYFDRYDWDEGKSTEILGIEITDEKIGGFIDWA